MNAAADKLAVAIQGAAAGAGIRFSDVSTPFVGHEVCSGAQWVNNADILAQYNSFHPNAAGYSGGYQPVVKASLGLGSGGGKGGKGKVTTGTVTSTDTQRGKVNVG